MAETRSNLVFYTLWKDLYVTEAIEGHIFLSFLCFISLLNEGCTTEHRHLFYVYWNSDFVTMRQICMSAVMLIHVVSFILNCFVWLFFFALMQFPLHVQFIHLSVGVLLLITITTIGVAHVCWALWLAAVTFIRSLRCYHNWVITVRSDPPNRSGGK